jgi:hypothetical protein
MNQESEKFVEPIANAVRPGTLAALSMTILKFSESDPFAFRILLSVGAILFLLSSLLIFFYTLYPQHRILWTFTAVGFMIGLICTTTSSVILLLLI